MPNQTLSSSTSYEQQMIELMREKLRDSGPEGSTAVSSNIRGKRHANEGPTRAYFELGPDFLYRDLDRGIRSIRLVEILPTSSSDPIKVDIIHCTLETCPPFIAVSYTWDHDGCNYRVKCQGKALRVERNLWHFLARCEKNVGSVRRFLWIDAICIDQGNVEERNHQIRQMQDIYSRAESVLVWLGEPQREEIAALAFGLLHDVDKLVNNDDNDGTDIRLYRSVKQWKALLQVCKLPYWTRIWIIQEIILPKVVTVRCGQFEADLDDLRRLCQCIEFQTRRHHSSHVSDEILNTQAWVVTKHRVVWWSSGIASRSSFKLRQLLYAYKSAHSTDIRDKIYGLLGLAQDMPSHLPPIIPDYSKHPKDIFIDVIRNQCRWYSARAHMRNQEFIAILRETLQIQPDDVRVEVLQNTDLRPYAHIILGEEELFSPMLCIGTVSEVRDMTVTEIPPNAIARFNFRSKRQISTYKSSLSDAAIDACLRQLESERHQLALKYTPDKLSGSNRRCSLYWCCHYHHSDRTMFQESLDARRDRGMRGWKSRESNDRRVACMTTNNLVGYTVPSVKPGDLLCVLDDSQECDTALIMREELDAYNQVMYRPVGPAVFQEAADLPKTRHIFTRTRERLQNVRNKRSNTAYFQAGTSTVRAGTMRLCYWFKICHLSDLLHAGFIRVESLPSYATQRDRILYHKR